MERGLGKVQPFQQLRLTDGAARDSPEPRHVIEKCLAGEAAAERYRVREKADVGLDRHGVAPRIEAEHARRALVGPHESREDADGRRLARAVGAQEAEHLAALHGEVHPIERADVAEPLANALYLQRFTRRFCHGVASSSTWPASTRKQRAPVR